MDRLIFQFRLHFDPVAVPCGTVERFTERMRGWFVEKSLDYGFGALGGRVLIYGDVGRHGGNATLEDRNALAEWVRRQGVKCKVALGDLEPESQADILRHVTELQFEAGNLKDD